MLHHQPDHMHDWRNEAIPLLCTAWSHPLPRHSGALQRVAFRCAATVGKRALVCIQDLVRAPNVLEIMNACGAWIGRAHIGPIVSRAGAMTSLARDLVHHRPFTVHAHTHAVGQGLVRGLDRAVWEEHRHEQSLLKM